jgi:hypothetical protein
LPLGITKNTPPATHAKGVTADVVMHITSACDWNHCCTWIYWIESIPNKYKLIKLLKYSDAFEKIGALCANDFRAPDV